MYNAYLSGSILLPVVSLALTPESHTRSPIPSILLLSVPWPLFLVHSFRSLILQLRVECIAVSNMWDVKAVPPEVAACCAETYIISAYHPASPLRTKQESECLMWSNRRTESCCEIEHEAPAEHLFTALASDSATMVPRIRTPCTGFIVVASAFLWLIVALLEL